MKILTINSYYFPNFHGGADRSVQLLAEGLQQAGHEVIVITLASGERNYVGTVHGVKTYYIAVNNEWSHIRDRNQIPVKKALWQAWTAVHPSMSRVLRGIVEEEQPDVVHTHVLAGFSTKPWLVASEFGAPVVHTLHDYFLLCPRGTMSRGNACCTSQCRHCRMVVAARRAREIKLSAVVGVSNYILDRHLQHKHFRSVPILTRIFNSTRETAMPPPPATDVNSALRVGFLGRIEPFKGLELLLSSISAIGADRLTLKIAGTGPDGLAKRLKKQWPLPNVEYLGLVDPDVFFPGIDILVVPSTYHDPAPRVVLEANSHGVPVLGSNLGGIPELVDDRQTGWIFDISDKGSLSRKLHQLAQQPGLCRDMRGKCRRKAGTFSTDLMVERHLDVYDRVKGRSVSL